MSYDPEIQTNWIILHQNKQEMFVNLDNVTTFYVDSKENTCFINNNGVSFKVDESMDQLKRLIDPNKVW